MTTPTPEQLAFYYPHPFTFRLPLPNETDPHFGLTRALYYLGEKRGWWQLARLRGEGKGWGVTLVPFDQVAAFILKHGLPSDTANDGKPATSGATSKGKRTMRQGAKPMK